MQISFTKQLSEYIIAHRKEAIILEIAQSDSSDFEVTELHPHFITQRQSIAFIKKQHFHKFETELIPVLLPNYRLDYSKEIIFDLGSFGPIHWIKTKGIQL